MIQLVSFTIVIRTEQSENSGRTGRLSCLSWDVLDSRTQYSSKGKECKQILSERENLNCFWCFPSLYCIQNFSLPKVFLEQVVPYFDVQNQEQLKD